MTMADATRTNNRMRLDAACKTAGLHYATHSTSDGVRRYRFFDQSKDYFEGNGLFWCEGLGKAVAFAEEAARRELATRAGDLDGVLRALLRWLIYGKGLPAPYQVSEVVAALQLLATHDGVCLDEVDLGEVAT